MLAWTWGTWPDVQIDFGRELYVAWRLSEGDVLYRDIAYFNGPLSPYLNALWFRLLGPGIQTLAFCNLLIAILLVALLYDLLKRIGDRRGALLGCATFLLLFVFGQLVEVGNYNFLTPYSHELTHGLLLAFLAIAALHASGMGKRPGLIAAAGFATGLAFLTKPEVFLALFAALSVGLGLMLRHGPWSVRLRLARVGLFAAMLVLPGVLAWAALSFFMPGDRALGGLIDPWRFLLRSDLRAFPFYRLSMGTDHLGGRLTQMAIAALAQLIFWTGVAMLDGVVQRQGKRMGLLLLLVLGACCLALQWPSAQWGGFARGALSALPIFAATVALGCWFMLGRRQGGNETPAVVLRLIFSVFAFVLLGKILFNARIHHYGFALAMPATMLLIVAMTSWLPQFARRFGGSGQTARRAWLLVWMWVIIGNLSTVGHFMRIKIHPVGEGRDRILADTRGPAVQEMLHELQRRVGPDQTLVVLPEGVMLNYLARRRSPVPYVSFMPLEMRMYGEDKMLGALQANPPDYIVLMNRSTMEYGCPFLGQGYGAHLLKWVKRHYQEVSLIGQRPFEDTRFGALLLRRSQIAAGNPLLYEASL